MDQFVTKTEIQFEICEPSVASLLQKLRLSDSSQKEKQVFYYDTADLDLIQQNTVIKINHTTDAERSSVKIKDLDEDSIPWKYLKDQDSKCEEDVYLDLSRVSCSVNAEVTDRKNILSLAQKNFIRAMDIQIAPEARLKIFGPVETTEQSFQTTNYKLVIESSKVRENLAAIELSARVDRKQALKVQTEIKNLLEQSNVILCADQQGKMKRLFKWLL